LENIHETKSTACRIIRLRTGKRESIGRSPDRDQTQSRCDKPLRMPADFAGLKMCIQPSKALEAQMHAPGAIPKEMVFSEVYHTLQTGVVDGMENPSSNFYTQKKHEVQSNLAVSNRGYPG
jgi:TRAP-type C4-dicarboxylate transport system substrate-binding protein